MLKLQYTDKEARFRNGQLETGSRTNGNVHVIPGNTFPLFQSASLFWGVGHENKEKYPSPGESTRQRRYSTTYQTNEDEANAHSWRRVNNIEF